MAEGYCRVDFSPHDGDYTGVVVQNNTFRTNGAMMKIGIAIGTMVSLCLFIYTVVVHEEGL